MSFMSNFITRDLLATFPATDIIRASREVKFNSESMTCPSGDIGFMLDRMRREAGYKDYLETVLCLTTLGEGPKIFRPASVTCEALEQVEMSIPGKDYGQVYPSVVVEMPDDYAERRLMPCSGEISDALRVFGSAR